MMVVFISKVETASLRNIENKIVQQAESTPTPEESRRGPELFHNERRILVESEEIRLSQITPLLPVNLLTSGDYAILSKTGVTNTGPTSVTGDIGTSPSFVNTSLTGFALVADSSNAFSTSPLVIGHIYAADYYAVTSTPTSILTLAVLDMQNAYIDAALRPNPDFVNLSAGSLNGETLEPGLYRWDTPVSFTNNITFNGSPTDVWILQVTGNFNAAANTIFTLTGGAQPENIFWQIAGAITLGTGSHIEGVFMTTRSISFETGSSLNGRALSQTTVTLDTATIVNIPSRDRTYLRNVFSPNA